MRSFRRLLPLLLLLLLLLLAGYAYFWLQTAGRLHRGIEDWAAGQRAKGASVSWAGLAVRGFPLAFRVTLDHPAYAGAIHETPYRFAAETLSGEARPWALEHWDLSAPAGAALDYGTAGTPPSGSLKAARLRGSFAPHQPGSDEIAASGSDVALEAEQLLAQGQSAVTIARGEGRAVLPDAPPSDHREKSMTGSLRLENLTFPPDVATPLGATVRDLTARFSLRGAIPPGPRDAALASWRDNGGTLDIEALAIDWGALAGKADGTLSLDAEMQPIGALTATIAGYAETIDALVAARNIKPGDGEIAKVALGLLAKPGPDGRPALTQPISLQNGSLYIGPARLMRLPRISW